MFQVVPIERFKQSAQAKLIPRAPPLAWMFRIIASGLAHLTATDTIFFLNLFLKKAMSSGEIFPIRINIIGEGGMHKR